MTSAEQETAGEYGRVVARFDGKTRLIEDAAGLQWIVQERRGKRWQSYWHCRTRAGLSVRYSHPAIDALPERFGDRGTPPSLGAE